MKKKKSTFALPIRRGARVVEEARLESVYTSKAYHGFESRSLRIFCVDKKEAVNEAAFFCTCGSFPLVPAVYGHRAPFQILLDGTEQTFYLFSHNALV